DCIGAIDGTHIRVKVSQCEALRYRGRKDYPTQNVLAACTFDLKFTYVLASWEGTASDSRIMKEALNRQDPLKLPEGAFGVLKKRFPIISSSTEPSYSVETKKLIIFACCILHNYLRGAYPNDELLAQVDAELVNDNDAHDEPPNPWQSNEEFRRGELIRDGIAANMWANYQV
uniref:DDE Tnp4 domain-containing protein n=1 Tax=Nicotiana tabacum TaxID=4097 RepID=A0A1S4CW74_TOBAC